MSNLPTPQQIIAQNTTKNSTLILAVSGGVDSVYLLNICLKLNLKLVVAHIDHNYRPNSKSDAKFVESLAKKHNLPFELKKLPKITSGNLEEKFRIARYNFLEKTRKKHQANWIVTGHHLNDNIETILFNLTRGTSIDGLGGMSPQDPERHLLRPLIYTPKQKILQATKKLKHIEDETNKDPTFSRNRIRLNIIPELQRINPSLEKTFLNNILLFQQTKNSIDQHIKTWIKKHMHNNKMPLTDFLTLTPAFQTTVLAQIYKKLYKSTTKFNTRHLNQIMGVIHKQHCNRKKEFGDKYFISIERDPNNQTKQIAIRSQLEKKP